ncbi:unnamed protein product [Paramecium sonneborni]|uniref:Uncharacterized protein n=1 Tax=Paramecium sonneborni TaxID=65129 RepID=A0A8S1LQU6_9CILI|nr:unnamed protein product [Paramecium sonneborni]
MQSQHAQSVSTGYLLQKNYINKLYTLSDSVCQQRKIVIPKQISLDKEQLYEELIREKQHNKGLQNEINKLKARLQCYEKDLVIQGEVDYKRELKQALIRLKKREEEVFELMQSTNYKRIIEMEKLIQSLKQELEKYHVYQNFQGSTESIINDNIELFQKLQQSTQQIKELEKIKAEYYSIARKHQQLQLVLQAKDQQLQKFRERDHLSEMNVKHSNKNESQLREELLTKDEEISHLKNQLAIARKTNIEDKAIIEQTQQDLQQKINQHEYERQNYKERIEHLQKEIQQLSEKARNFDRYLTVNQKRKTTHVDDQQSNSQYTQAQDSDQMVKSIQKSQVEDIATELKLILRKNNISLQEAEQLLFKGNEISIQELEQLLGREPFKVLSSNTLARYMIEDMQEKEFEYNSDLKSPVPHVRSVFRTLLQHYQLNFDDQILQTVAKACLQIFEFCSRKNISKLTQQELLESISQLDLQWNSKCFDCFQQLYYNKFKGFLQFDVQNIKKLFEQYQIQ